MVIRGFLGYLQSTEHRWGSSNSRAKRKAGQVTLQRYYTALKVFFNWCLSEGYIDTSLMNMVRKPEATSKMIRGLNTDEISILLNAVKGRDFDSVRNRALLLLVLDSGLRLSELANLKSNDVKSEIIAVLGKGVKWRMVRVGGKTRKALWEYTLVRKDLSCEVLWLTQYGSPLTASGIYQVIRKLGIRCGIHVSPHKLRHTMATMWLRNGGDSLMLQRLLGHTTLTMTNRYCQAVGCYDAIEAHKRYSPMDNLLK
jgi:integrase/recombinase XerC